jgi:hypothetical protein
MIENSLGFCLEDARERSIIDLGFRGKSREMFQLGFEIRLLTPRDQS